jgi:TP901 family phage tail tape measure protein
VASRDLKVTLVGEDKTGGAFGSAASGAGKLGAAVGAAMVVAGAAVAGFVAKGVKDAIGFQTSMAEVFTLLPGTSKKAMDAMSADVLNFSSRMGIATTEAVPALYQALSAGVPKENVFKFLEDAGKLGIAGVTDLKTATGVLALAVNNFTGEGLNATQASDLLFTAVRVGTTTMDELSGAVANVGPGAAALGIKFGEVTGALAAMTATSGNANQSSTQLRALLGELGNEGSKVGKVFAEVSGQTFREFTANGGTLQEALSMLGEETAKTGKGADTLFGSIEAGQGVMALTGENAVKFTDAMAAMGDSTGATDRAFATMEESVSRKWEKMKVAIQNFGIEIGMKLLPVITSAVEGMQAKFEQLSAWWQVNGPAITAAAAVLAAGIVATFTAVRDAIGSVASFLMEHQTVALAVFAAIGVGLAAWGVAATINAAKNVAAWFTTATAARTAGASHTLTTGQMVVRWAFLGAQSLAHAAKVVAGWAMTAASSVAAGAVMAAQTAVHVAKWAFLGAQSLMHAAKVAAAWLIAMGPIGLVIAAVIGLVALIIANWDTVKKVTVDLWNAVKAATSAAWDWIKSAVSAAVSAVSGAVSGAWNAVRAATTAVWDDIKGATSAAWDAVKGLVSGAIGAVLGAIGGLADIPGRVAGWFGAARDAASGALDRLVGVVGGIPGRVTGALGDLGGLLLNAGRSIVSGLIRGIDDKFDALAAKARDLAQKIKNFLPFSPAKEGPFSGKGNPYYSGRSIGDLVAAGLGDSRRAVDAAMTRLTDVGDVAGMQVGGTGYVMNRIEQTASQPAVVRAAPPLSAAGGIRIDRVEIVVNDARDPRATALAVRDELVKLGRRNGNIFGGLA